MDHGQVFIPPREKPYTPDELKLTAADLAGVCCPMLPKPQGRGPGSSPGRLAHVVMVCGAPFWCFDGFSETGFPKRRALRPLYSIEQWGNRPKHVDWTRLGGGDYGTGVICLGPSGAKKYVIGPSGESIVVEIDPEPLPGALREKLEGCGLKADGRARR
jgi:hypothetical protein